MTKNHLVTGATGFVGSAIVLELLERTDDSVKCLVRKRGDFNNPQSRLQQSLAAAAKAFDREHLLGEIAERCQAVPGDILTPHCGDAALDCGPVSEIWHSAASLKYENKDQEEILRHNVEGVRNILALARGLSVKTFNHISTAYVAGTRQGRILEELTEEDEGVNNCYEQSKIRGERLIAASEGFHWRIYRPSIVIGHSQTLAATSFSGMYGLIRETIQFRRTVSRKLGNFLQHRPLRVLADAATQINFIPVDAVAANAVAISRSNTSKQIFHLTNDYMPTVGEKIGLLYQELGLRRPRYVSSPKQFTSIDEALNRGIDFYSSYLLSSKDFDRTNTDAVVGSDASRWVLDNETMQEYLRWYLSYLGPKAGEWAGKVEQPALAAAV